MRLLEPLADPGGRLARRNPTAKLAASALLTFILLTSVDPVTPAVAIVVELALAPLFGIRYPRLLRRGWPLLASAAAVFACTLVFTTHGGGATLLRAGPLTLTAGALSAALGLALRIVAVALPGLIVFATTDPTDLADSLIQQVRVPARFAIGSLVAFRLVPLLADEWEMLTMARRARGVDAGRNPAARVRLFTQTTFALLVGAIRRGTRLATAMDARGFDSATNRTVARPQRFDAADGALIVGALVVAAVAIGTSVAAGTFRPLFGP
jgi:energy-coupling factor transport system permease protein